MGCELEALGFGAAAPSALVSVFLETMVIVVWIEMSRLKRAIEMNKT